MGRKDSIVSDGILCWAPDGLIDNVEREDGMRPRKFDERMSYPLRRWLEQSPRQEPWTSLRLFSKSEKSALLGELDSILTAYTRPANYAASNRNSDIDDAPAPYPAVPSESTELHEDVRSLPTLAEPSAIVTDSGYVTASGFVERRLMQTPKPKSEPQPESEPIPESTPGLFSKSEQDQDSWLKLEPQPEIVPISESTRGLFSKSTWGLFSKLEQDQNSWPIPWRETEATRELVRELEDGPEDRLEDGLEGGLEGGLGDEQTSEVSLPHDSDATPPLFAKLCVDGLKAHTSRFISLLASYGIARDVPVSSQPNTLGFDSQPPGEPGQQGVKRPFAPSSKIFGGIGDREASESEEEEEENRRNQKRKKTRHSAREHELLFACPFYKFNNLLYVKCKDWTCGSDRIETVKRHVLGRKHQSSPHMNATKHNDIKGLGVFKTNEDRWKAIYAKLFDIHRHNLCTVPNPYYSITGATADNIHLGQPISTLPGPLPSAWEGLSNNLHPQDLSLNTHAEAYANESLRLSEQYIQRRNEIRIESAARLETIRQSVMDEEQRLLALLRADLQTDLRNLLHRHDQGLPPDTVEAEPLATVPENTHGNPAGNISPLVPPAFEARIYGHLGHESTIWSLEELSPQQAPVQSNADDSGYGTLTMNTSCTCESDFWCVHCGKPGSAIFDPHLGET